MTNIRIGYEHLDTLITYPDAWFLSGCVVPIQNEGRWIDTTHRWVAHATTRALGVSPVHGQPVRMSGRAYDRRRMSPPHVAFRRTGDANQAARTPHASRASRNRTWLPPATQTKRIHDAHTKRARTNRSGRATYSAQALGRLPWFAPCLRRSRRLRPRFDMSFSLGLLSRLKHFCTHWPKPPRHRPFAATKVTEKRAATPTSSARAARRDHALS